MGEVDAAHEGHLMVLGASERFTTRRPGITTRHCFSFGDHYDPARVSFGPLIALNDEQLEPGAGYASHAHRDVEIVTWVLEGTLRHEDSLGGRSTVSNGTVQRLTAGTGVTHTESNAGASTEPLRLVQLWFGLGGTEVAPSYETWTLEDEADRFGFTVVAGSRTPRRSTTLTVPGVEVRVGHLPADSTGHAGGRGRGARESWLYVARGCLETQEVGQLDEGDSVHSTGPVLRYRVVEPTVALLIELLSDRPDRVG